MIIREFLTLARLGCRAGVVSVHHRVGGPVGKLPRGARHMRALSCRVKNRADSKAVRQEAMSLAFVVDWKGSVKGFARD